MLVIGITGSLATGKSTVTAMFRKRGAKVLDADKITHQLMRPGKPCFHPIVRRFGKDMLKNGRIDRKKLADVVFADRKTLQALVKIVHPQVIKVIKGKLKSFARDKKRQFVVIDAPLLIEAGLDRYVDFLIVVKANRKKQLERITKRIDISLNGAKRRIQMQMPLKNKIRFSDIVIDNRGTRRQTKNQVDAVWQKLCQIRQSR